MNHIICGGFIYDQDYKNINIGLLLFLFCHLTENLFVELGFEIDRYIFFPWYFENFTIKKVSIVCVLVFKCHRQPLKTKKIGILL